MSLGEKIHGINPLKITIVKFVIIFSLLIIAVNSIILVVRALNSYNKEVENAKINIETISRVASEHIELTFLAVDVVLKRAIEKRHFNSLFGSNLEKDTQNNIITWVDETPQISAMLLADESGNITQIYRKTGFKPWMEEKENVSNMDYFQYHVDEYDSLHISKQESYQKNHTGFVVLSRRLDNIDGSFGGIILAAVSIEFLLDFYDSVDQNQNTKLFLTTTEQKPIIGSGFALNEKDRKIYEKARKSFNATKNKKKSYITEGNSGFADELRIMSFKQFGHLDLALSLIFYGDDILSYWYSERLSDLIFYIVFIVFVLVVAFFSTELAVKVQKLRASEREALAASKAKSDFLANMSHELRTPLNAVIGFSEMLISEYFGKINSKQKERLNDINSCGNHLLSLINDVLDFSKGQAGKLELRLEEVSVFKLTRETFRIFDERASRDGISIIANIDKGSYIMADKRKVKQILINLISNSIKFSESGDVIEVLAEVNEVTGEYLLKVKDTGAGMNQEDVPKALSAFGQVHQDSAIGGTGLGLPICKIFAELHGGRLEIESVKGKGTTVTVVFPKTSILSDPI